MGPVVEVRNGYKYYGRKSNPKVVLNNINMHVSAGSIYGLLGASGCGKTTLLSCIVGQRTLNGGEISVCGMPPGKLPGSRLGYMPQEIALVEEMTVKENVFYFGRIYGLTDEKLREKFKILGDLLQLPPARQLVKNCSGGQQRRVSFACAMIHDPELLILDEPTVGLDPMLRDKIWAFLVDSIKNAKRAVILTTHYIEEAKQAQRIGIMRNGILLAEDTPTNIMLKLECNSIEEAFLVLCLKQGDTDAIQGKDDSSAAITNLSHQRSNQYSRNKQQPDTNAGTTEPAVKFVVGEYDDKAISIDEYNNDAENRKRLCYTTKGHLKALMAKNFVQLIRQPSGIFLMLFFSIIPLSCFYLAYGKMPKNFKIGIVNSEIENYKTCFDTSLRTVWPSNDTCEFNKISCRYTTELGDSIFEQKYFNSTKEAWSAAKRTDVIGFIHFPHNFSASMKHFLDDGLNAKDSDIANAELIVHIDMTDQIIAYYLERKLRDNFNTFLRHVLDDCGIPIWIGKIPIHFEKPVYGSFDIEVQQFSAPGVVMTTVFFLATVMTSTVFISEREDGVWDRTLVAGVSATEILWAHFILQIIVIAIQSIEVITFIGLVFDTYNKGDTCTLVGLVALTAFCGMMHGLLMSVYCKSYTLALLGATGVFLSMIMLCGFWWPLKAMPKFMQNIVIFLPFTIPTTAARNVLEKGWSITNGQVYNGFIVLMAWSVIFFVLCIVGLRRKA